MLSSSERWTREVKHIQKFGDTNLLYCFAFFFFFNWKLQFDVCPESRQVFDKTRLFTSKNLHSRSFLKSKSIGSFTIMMNSFRKRSSVPNVKGFRKAGKAEEILVYVVQKWLQRRRHVLVFVPLCCYMLLHSICIFLLFSVQPNSA